MLYDRFKQIRAFVFAANGVLTKQDVWLAEGGGLLYSFSSRDDYALQVAHQRNYPIAVIGNGDSSGIKNRLQQLGIQQVFFGSDDQESNLSDWLSQQGLLANEVLYMGSEIPDVAGMRMVGFPACPADATEEVKGIAEYVSYRNGGSGAVRDVLEKVMKLQGTWL